MRPKHMSALLALICTAVSLFPGTADAVSVTNRDSREHAITVIEGDAKTDHVLKASTSIDGICLKGCLIRLNGSENDEYELEGTEVVSIEDGYLYYDGPEAPAASPDSQKNGAPSAPAPAQPK